MIPLWRYLMWPAAWLNRLTIGLRNKLFELGVWKSVEFEVPVIYVGGLGSEPSLAISFMISDILNAPLHVERLPVVSARASGNDQSPYLYFDSYQDIIFSTTHKVLGVSEWIQHHEDTGAIVIDQSFALDEIRPQMKVAISDFRRPFYKDVLKPVGNLRCTRSEMQGVDVVLFCHTPADADLKREESMARKFLSDQTSVFYIKNSLQDLASFNSVDKIEFIKDRDNFARLMVNVLQNANQ